MPPAKKKRLSSGVASATAAGPSSAPLPLDVISVSSSSSNSGSIQSLDSTMQPRRSSRIAAAAMSTSVTRTSASGARAGMGSSLSASTSSSSRARRPAARQPPSPPDSLDEPLPLSRNATPECIDADDPLSLAMIAEGVYNGDGREVDYVMDDVAQEVQPYEPSSPISLNGRSQWKGDVQACGKLVGENGWAIEGYVGLEAAVSEVVCDEEDTSANFKLFFSDMEGDAFVYSIKIVFGNVSNYPTTYNTLISVTVPSKAPRRSHQRAFERFTTVHDLAVKDLIIRLVCALQGDDEANGGEAQDMAEEEEGMGDMEDEQYESLGQPSRGFEVAKGSGDDLGREWGKVKTDFEQAKSMGYRPGLTQISDYWVISYSIPLKNMAIDPNELAIWDDDLVQSWSEDQRFTLLMRVDRYGASYADTKWSLTLDKNYKPPNHVLARHTAQRNQSTTSSATRTFFLSDALASHLTVYPRCYQLRTGYSLNWDTADRYGMDDIETQNIFENQHIPVNEGPEPEADDPIEKGFSTNLPLCAFYWICRRFVGAPKYCLNCGVQVRVVGRRPYVCDKPLCLYGMMSLGLGPSLSHTIQTHPGVVDLLLSFAHAAASSATRMDLPLGINIDVPRESGTCTTSTLLDDLPDASRRKALVWLIESLPKVSEMAEHLKSGKPLSGISAPKGALTVLRWVVGSCRAYLKEGRPGEGVVTDTKAPVASNHSAYYNAGLSSDSIRQFSFVVGNPEQEENFSNEIREAKVGKPSLEQYPTMLAFHGSGAERWHNILRTGLDFQEIACGRAYGNGVYFAADSVTSMSTYARPSGTRRPNADFHPTRATALVELVNVPETFVSRNPYYVVNKVKQIKPFLLLVEGTVPEPAFPEEGGDAIEEKKEEVVVKMERRGSGELFKHDPALQLKPTYFYRPLQVRMPEKIVPKKYVDKQPDDASDSGLYATSSSSKPAKKQVYTPYPESFYRTVTLLPPPTHTSPQATKALMRELKGVMKAQEDGRLPFWLVPDSDRLYSWTLELFEFDEDSLLKQEMKRLKITAMIAEVRFPASFPVSPPFMPIIYPRCLPFAMGGGGNITAGGSICNEILTASGWNPTYCVEAMVRDIMLNMTAAERPARIDMQRWKTPYGISEAVEAYKRVAGQHGWEVPKDFDKILQVSH